MDRRNASIRMVLFAVAFAAILALAFPGRQLAQGVEMGRGLNLPATLRGFVDADRPGEGTLPPAQHALYLPLVFRSAAPQ